MQSSGPTWWEMADSRRYYVPSGGSASSDPPLEEIRQLEPRLRAGGLQQEQSAAADTGVSKLKGKQRVSSAGDQVLSPAASVAAPKEPSSETQPVVDGELDSLYAVDREEPFSAAAAQTSNGINTVNGEQLMAASVRHKRPDLYQH